MRKPLWASVVTVVVTLGCGGEMADDRGAAGDAAPVGAAAVEESLSVTATGEGLTSPDTYELRPDCVYSRGAGSFHFRGDPPDIPESGASLFEVVIGGVPGQSAPLADGTYPAQFVYAEANGGEGRGPAEVSLSIVAHTPEELPVIEWTATGAAGASDVKVEAKGRCTTWVGG